MIFDFKVKKSLQIVMLTVDLICREHLVCESGMYIGKYGERPKCETECKLLSSDMLLFTKSIGHAYCYFFRI